MRRSGIFHAELAGIIAGLGHGETVVIADAGLPMPPGVRVLDVGIRAGLPGTFDVLDAVLDELSVEHALIAAEAAPDLAAAFRARVPSAEAVPHADFKRAAASARAVVRTGECTPFANILLVGGVTF